MHCPLCSSPNTQTVKSIDVEPLVAEWHRSFQIDVRPEFHNLSAFELRSCSDCLLRFFTPDSLAGSAWLYAQLDKFDWYYQPRKWEFDAALKDLRGLRKIMEVGCGIGGFIALAQKQAGLELEGLEQNAEAVREAERRGLHVRMATVEEAAEQAPAKYDALCSFQVLEHVSRPGDFLRACCSLLRPGGRLLLGLPNTDSFLRYQFNALDLPPHHMTRWTLQVLSRLPQLLPLRLQRIELEPLADCHVEDFVDAYCSVFARGPLVPLRHPGIKARLSGLLRRSGLQQWLRGQTVYVCYERS